MRIGAVVPAYNEGPRLGRVLEVLSKVTWLKRVVVVNDGSGDDTGEVARRYPVFLVEHGRNLGKGAALQTGLARLRDMEAVLFLDADLVGLREKHLRVLLEPLLRRRDLGMVVGTFRGGRWHVDLQQRYFSVLNGQRALSRRFLDCLPDLSWSRWGVEVLLNSFAAHAGVPFTEVFLDGLTHVIKEEKFGPLLGFGLRLKMYHEVLRAAGVCRRRYPAAPAATPSGPNPQPPPIAGILE
ncbi:MAG: glycosyltransferase family 2 protein [Clostridia bacterium]|nr:glycosyltransferase family 2 protein [Clostridia bacterium]MDH7572595.1 glycosyltransferase family 2 protein [Clostridia bacterium]